MRWIVMGIVAVSAGCVADSVEDGEQATESVAAAVVEMSEAELRTRVARHHRLMDGEGTREQELESLRTLQEQPGTLPLLVASYEEAVASGTSVESRVGYGRVRWNILLLMRELADPRALSLLLQVAEEPLPDPEQSEPLYEIEYMIRLRAIDALGRIGAIAPLQRMYERRAALSGAAGVALYEAGHAPPDLEVTDFKTAIANHTPLDPKDNHPRGSSPPKDSPAPRAFGTEHALPPLETPADPATAVHQPSASSETP